MRKCREANCRAVEWLNTTKSNLSSTPPRFDTVLTVAIAARQSGRVSLWAELDFSIAEQERLALAHTSLHSGKIAHVDDVALRVGRKLN